MHSDVVQYHWFWYNFTNESVYSLCVKQSCIWTWIMSPLSEHTQNISLLLPSCLPCDPLRVTVIHVNGGEENHRNTEQKLVTKHLQRRGLLSLEINGVLNKLLLLEQSQCQREFAVKEKPHTCPGKLPSHYSVCLIWTRASLPGKCVVKQIFITNMWQTGFCCEILFYPSMEVTWAILFSLLFFFFNYYLIWFLFCITHFVSVCCLWTFHQLRQSIQSMSQ